MRGRIRKLPHIRTFTAGTASVADYQKDFFTGRWRTVRAPNPLEQQIQISLMQRLKWQCRRDDVVYYHTPNGELRDKRAAAKLKAMGTLPGVADLTFIYPGPQVLYLELKAKGNTLTREQETFGERVKAIGCRFEVADTIDDAVLILRNAGILP
jgi:hypothetical protein